MEKKSSTNNDLPFSSENEENLPATTDETFFQNESYLQTIPLIKKIVSYKLSFKHRESIEDVTQQILLKLWSWKTRKERSLSSTEWQKLANIASQNEVNTFYSKKLHKESPLSETDNEEIYLADKKQSFSIVGNTPAETSSLLNLIWKTIPQLSLRQRYAVLLGQDFILYLIAHRCCRITDLAQSLQLSRAEMENIIKSLPLSNAEICEIMKRIFKEEITEQKMWEARTKGKLKLLAALKK
jgi:hypothetical protein